MLRLPKVRPMGWAAALARWLARSPVDNRWLIGRLVEIGGNHVSVDGLTFALDNPLIRTRDKSSVCSGVHEAPELALVQARLVAELPVIELGGGIGIVSCHINRMLARPRDHIVVEANPDLIPTLETNRRLNRCQYQIRTAALAYGGEQTVLAIDSWVTSRVGGRGTRRAVVATTTLAKLLRESGFARINLVVDIEGAEADLVEQEGTLLSQRVRTLILEAHPSVTGAERAARMIAAIRSLGFAETAQVRQVFAFDNLTAHDAS
jgi:FkbM family methyltransferase